MPDPADLDSAAGQLRESWSNGPYYELAEKDMQWQWEQLIAPWIHGRNLSRLVELAPGHGRNTARLIEFADEIHLVDVDEHCIDACRARFSDYSGPCDLHYHVNDGSALDMIETASATFLYTWDAMVHFDTRVIERYVCEFARILEPGGYGFVHHSNYGETVGEVESSPLDNPHWRSTMSKDRFARLCFKTGLNVVRQKTIEWGAIPDLDCVTLFRKPSPRR